VAQSISLSGPAFTLFLSLAPGGIRSEATRKNSPAMEEIRRGGVKRASRLGFPRDSASFPVSLDHRSFPDSRSGRNDACGVQERRYAGLVLPRARVRSFERYSRRRRRRRRDAVNFASLICRIATKRSVVLTSGGSASLCVPSRRREITASEQNVSRR